MLPVLQRELQVASRRKATFFFRILAALIGFAIAATDMLFRDGLPDNGANLLKWITIAGAIFAVREGGHRAAVSLSEERANGTLGLLFLTPLSILDVVAGKFMTASLLAFQSLLALAPVLAITLLLGGVSAGEMARYYLWVFNITFFFIAACLMISSMTASEVGAIVNSVALFFAVLFAFFYQLDSFHPRAPQRFLFDPISPAADIPDFVYRIRAPEFWGGILMTHALAWSFLILAALALRRNWRRAEVWSKLAFLWTRKPKVRTRRRGPVRIVGDTPPLQWLSLRNIYPDAALFIVLLNTAIAIMYFNSRMPEGAFALAILNVITLALGISVHSAYSLARAKAEGLIELIAVSTLTDEEVVAGQISSIRRVFFWPSIVSLILLAFVWPWNERSSPRDVPQWLWGIYYLYSISVTLRICVRTGVWAALKSKTPARAVIRTLFVAIFLPWVVPLPAVVTLLAVCALVPDVRKNFRAVVQGRREKVFTYSPQTSESCERVAIPAAS